MAATTVATMAAGIAALRVAAIPRHPRAARLAAGATEVAGTAGHRAVVIPRHPCVARPQAVAIAGAGTTALRQAEVRMEAATPEAEVARTEALRAAMAVEILRHGTTAANDSLRLSRRAPLRSSGQASGARTPFYPSPPHRQEAPKGASCPPRRTGGERGGERSFRMSDSLRMFWKPAAQIWSRVLISKVEWI